MPKRRRSCPLEEKDLNATSGSVVQNSPIFDSGLHHVLIQILNQLDAVSFVNFARTCSDFYDLCSNTKDVLLPFGRESVDNPKNNFSCRVTVRKQHGGGVVVELHKLWKSDGYDDSEYNRRLLTEEELQVLQKMPFDIEIEEVVFYQECEIDSLVVEAMTLFFRRFPRVTIRKITPIHIRDWESLADFVQEFVVKCIGPARQIGMYERIPTDLLPVFLSKVEDFNYNRFVPDDLLLNATSKFLFLSHARISTDTFKELFKKFYAGEFIFWSLGRERGEADLFIDACREFMDVVETEEEIDPSNFKPFVIYRTFNRRIFHFLKADGSLGKFGIGPFYVDFGYN